MAKFILLCGMLTALLVNGCFFASPQDVTYYDLNLPPHTPLQGIQLSFQDFENFSGAGVRMRYRVNEHQQIIDSLNKWAAPPEDLVRQYLLGALTGSTENIKPRKNLTVKGRLEIFELDLDKQEAILQISYSVEGSSYKPPVERQIVRATAPLAKNTPPEFAKAFSEAAAQVTKTIRKDILSYY